MTQFLRRHAVRIMIGAVLFVAVYSAVSVYATYRREQTVALRAGIERVGIAYCGPSWVPESIQQRLPFFDRIVSLYLSDAFERSPELSAKISDVISELGSLTNLSTLELSSATTDANLENIKGLVSLVRINLGSAQISDTGLSNLAALTDLEDISLYGCNHVTDRGLEHLKGLTKLDHLDVSYTQVTDVGLEQLTGLKKLQHLDLVGTQVTDAGLMHLNGLTSLEWLDLDSTRTTADGRAMLQKALPNCTITPP